MTHGEAALGALVVRWQVPDAFPDAAGGLQYLAAQRGDAAQRVTWRIDVGSPGPAPTRYDAFFGAVRLVLDGARVRLWAPHGELEIGPQSMRGVVDGPSARLAAGGPPAPAAHAGLAHQHAAVVRLDGRTLVLPGGSGSGKTSAALAIARAGGELLTDDVAYVGADHVVWPVRRPPHVAQPTLDAHAGLDVLGPVLDGVLPKLRVRVPHEGPAAPAPIDAIVLPQLDASARTHVERVEPVGVFPVLLGCSALAVVPGTPHREAMIDVLASLAELPAVRLLAGPDALADPSAIARVLREWLSALR